MRMFCLLIGLCAAGLVSECVAEDGHSARTIEATTLSRTREIKGLTVTHRTLAPVIQQHGARVDTLTFVNALPVRRELEVALSAVGMAARRIVLEPEQSLTVDFIPPSASDYHSSYRNRSVDLREGRAYDLARIPGGTYYGSHRDEVNVLTTASFDAIGAAADYSKEDEQSAGSGGAKPKPWSMQSIIFQFHTLPRTAADCWSADARAYSGYDLMVLSAADWQALAPSVRRALIGHVALGGVLVLAGEPELPAEAIGFPVRPMPPEAAKARRVWTIGDGRICLCPEPAADVKMPLARADLAELGAAARARLRTRFGADANIRNELVGMPALNVPTVEVSLFIVLLGFFALVVLPATLAVCIRRQRRLAALVALPTVAGVLSVLIVLAIVATYGFTPYLNEDATVWLNQLDRRAACETRACVFAPSDVTDRLCFSRDAAVTAVGTDMSWRTPSESFTLVHGDRSSARGKSWLTPLKPVVYRTCEVRDTTARLVVEELAADKVRVTNLLGAGLTGLKVVDSRGTAFETKDLPEGATRELTPGGKADIAPSSYRAEMDALPFHTDTLGGTKAKRLGHTVVYGGYGKEVTK